LRHVEQTLAAHPNRASLLDLKASLELSLGELDSARQTVEQFVKSHPDSPTALACQALLLAELKQARPAVQALQRALGMVDREMPQRVFEAIGATGSALLGAGHVVSAQAHLWLHAAIAPRDDTRAYQAIIGLNHYSGLPLLLRDQLRFVRWPDDVVWKDEAEQASRLADQGKWQQSVGIIDRLGQRYGADPTLVFNRALLGGWLVDDRSLVAGLHAYAQLDVPLDDAVEAEAIAQLLDPDLKEQMLDTVVHVYAIDDQDLLISKLASDRRLQTVKLNTASRASNDQPPPRHTFVLFDRLMPESGADLQRDKVPRLSAIVAVYGRQTDRAERLELTVDKGPAFAGITAALRDVAGESLGEMTEEKAIAQVSPTEKAMNWRWQFPRDTPVEVRQRLLADERREAIVERWPTLPRPALGGKSPREAADDPQLRIPLMAAVLILEQGSNTTCDDESFAALRGELGLPQPQPIEPAGQSVQGLRLVRVPRLNFATVSDDDLVQLYRRALMADAQLAVAKTAEEAVRRPSLAERIPHAEAYKRLIAAEHDPDRALALIDAARQESHAAGQSVAVWDLAELEQHIETGNVDEAKQLLERIEREYIDDPQVAAALYQLLYETGVIHPDAAMGPGEVDEETPLAAVGTAAEPTSGRIWTPDSERPSGGKSTLWTPS
jgi:hypothetical protein